MSEGDDATRAGEVLNGRYRLGTRLGEDGAVEIYAGTDAKSGDDVTVRLLKPEFALQPGAIEQLVKIARTLSEMRHPNLAPVLAVESDDTGIPFVVESPTAGQSLTAMLEQFPEGMPMGAARVLLAPIVEGLARAHVAGGVHGRVHPDRILLVERAGGVVPCVLHSQPGACAGLPDGDAYTPPECRGGGFASDPAADVWSLGVLLYHMLSGRPPQTGAGSTLVALAELAAHLPDGLTSAVAACLWDDPLDRVPDAGVLWMRIEGALSASAPASSDAGVGASAVNALGATMVATAPVVAGKLQKDARPVAAPPQPPSQPPPSPPAERRTERMTPVVPAADVFKTPPPPPPAMADAGLAPTAPPPPQQRVPAQPTSSSSPPGFGLASGPPSAHVPPPPPARPEFAGGPDAALLGSGRGPDAAAPPAPVSAAAARPAETEWPEVEVNSAPPATVSAAAARPIETEWPEVAVDSAAPQVSAAPAPAPASEVPPVEPAKGLDNLALAFSPLDRDEDDIATSVGFSSAPPGRGRDSTGGKSGQRRRGIAGHRGSAGLPGSEPSHEDGFSLRSSSLSQRPAADADTNEGDRARGRPDAAGEDGEEAKRKAVAVSDAQVARLIAMREQQETSGVSRWLRLLLLLLLLLFVYKASTWLYDPELTAARDVFGPKLTLACLVLAGTSVVGLVRAFTMNVKGTGMLVRPMVYLYQAVTLFICLLVAGIVMGGGAGAGAGGAIGGGVMGMIGGVARGGLAWSSTFLFFLMGIYMLLEAMRSMGQSMGLAAGMLVVALAGGGASWAVVAQTVLVPRAKPVPLAQDDDEDLGDNGLGGGRPEAKGQGEGEGLAEGAAEGTQEYLEKTAEAAAAQGDESGSVIDQIMEVFTPKSADTSDPGVLDNTEAGTDGTQQAVERKTVGGGGEDELQMVDQLRDIRKSNAKDIDKLKEQMPSVAE